jgi:hypothetical protein
VKLAQEFSRFAGTVRLEPTRDVLPGSEGTADAPVLRRRGEEKVRRELRSRREGGSSKSASAAPMGDRAVSSCRVADFIWLFAGALLRRAARGMTTSLLTRKAKR